MKVSRISSPHIQLHNQITPMNIVYCFQLISCRRGTVNVTFELEVNNCLDISHLAFHCLRWNTSTGKTLI